MREGSVPGGVTGTRDRKRSRGRRRRGSPARRRRRRAPSSRARSGRVVVHSADALRRPRLADEVGHEVDRARREHGAVRARRARGRGATAACGSRTTSVGGPPSCSASEASVAGGSARGLREAVKTTARTLPEQRAEHARGVLVVEDGDHGDERAVAHHVGQRRRPARPCPDGLCAPSRIVSGSSPTTCRRPGTPHARGDLGHLRRLAAARAGALAAAAATCEVRALVAAQRHVEPAGPHDPRAGLAAPARATSASTSPSTSVAPGRTTASFSRAMSAIVGPSQRVCSRPTLVSTQTAGVEHVGGVPAPAEAGLDDRDLDLARAPARRARRRSAARTASRARRPRACGRPSRRRPRRARPRRRTRRAARSSSPIRIRSAKRTRCGER